MHLSDLLLLSIGSLQTVLFHFLPLVFSQGHQSFLVFLQRIIRTFLLLSGLKQCSQVTSLLFHEIVSLIKDLAKFILSTPFTIQVRVLLAIFHFSDLAVLLLTAFVSQDAHFFHRLVPFIVFQP